MTSTTEIYTRLLSDPSVGYGFGDHWKPVWSGILATDPASLLDVGCGRGGLVEVAQAAGIAAQGCDVAPVHPWIRTATLPVLPYRNAQFDVVGCFDVLEHLPEFQIGAAVDELRRVCRKHLIVSVAECSDVRDVPGLGLVELHLTRKPLSWWLAQCDAEVIPVASDAHWRHYLEIHL
jgi:2-polyprenyl-3-methyl-5-hydroxy-6-metoxy-1,4-benzoquinol methylase